MAQEITLSDEDIRQLENAVAEAYASGAVASDLQDDFCKIWPTAKQALNLLLPLLGMVPGVGMFAKAAISIVVAAGDAAHRVICK